MNTGTLLSMLIVLLSCTACSKYTSNDWALNPSPSDLQFEQLAKSWDEGIPLGNATIGTLVWQRDSALRLSLDRTDLWNLRPMDSISGPNNRFAWVYEQVKKAITCLYRKNTTGLTTSFLLPLRFQELHLSSIWEK